MTAADVESGRAGGMEDDAERLLENFKTGDWVEVSYYINKQRKIYTGKILQVDPDAPVYKFEVQYVRNRGSYFSYPDTEDVDWIKPSKIIHKLGHPSVSRHGHIKFD